MNLGYAMFVDGFASGPVGIVEDHFGPVFKRFHEQHEAGEIFEQTVYVRFAALSTSDDLTYVSCCKILRPVHPNTVRATLRKIGLDHLKLDRGYWYEVHGD